jgi:hypothetical protein
MLELDYAKTQWATLPLAAVTCFIMLTVALITGVIPWAK